MGLEVDPSLPDELNGALQATAELIEAAEFDRTGRDQRARDLDVRRQGVLERLFGEVQSGR